MVQVNVACLADDRVWGPPVEVQPWIVCAHASNTDRPTQSHCASAPTSSRNLCAVSNGSAVLCVRSNCPSCYSRTCGHWRLLDRWLAARVVAPQHVLSRSIVRADIREGKLDSQPENRHLDPRVVAIHSRREWEPNRRVDVPLLCAMGALRRSQRVVATLLKSEPKILSISS